MTVARPALHDALTRLPNLSCFRERLDQALTHFDSQPQTVTPYGLPDAPAAPTALPGDGQVSLMWIAPAANGSAITSYTITASPGGATMSATGTAAMFVGLTDGTAYTFTVAAVNAAGTGPASPPSISVTPTGLPGAPTGVSAVAGIRSASVS